MKKALSWLIAIALAVALGMAIKTYALSTLRVTGTSMEPTLMTGDIALITKTDYRNDTPNRGDVVQLTVPGRSGTYIKRVIALPGETIEISGGSVIINGAPLEENYAAASNIDYPAVTLNGDEFFVLGDNREKSYDSREEDFGAISADQFLGRVRFVIWPISRIGGLAGDGK